MKRKKIISIPIIILLMIYIATSLVLINKKPDTSHINTAKKVAKYSKPSVVRVINHAVVKWNYNFNHNYYYNYSANSIMKKILGNFFNKINYQTLIGGSGSGAIINSKGYIVTNAHVVQLSRLTDSEIKDIAIQQLVNEFDKFVYENSETSVSSNALKIFRTYLLMSTQVNSVNTGLKIILPGGEDNVFDGEIKSYGAPVGEGKDVAVVKIECENLPALKLGDSDTVHIQDNIWVCGYPAAAESEIFDYDSFLEVSITDGKVSAKKRTNKGAPVIQVSAPVTHGNSGGPVIKSDGTIIGLLTFRGNTVNNQEVQGFSFAVPVNTVKEFVRQAGAENESNQTNVLYKEGLELYWGGYYKDALVKFEAIQRLFPNHSEVDELIQDCQQKSETSKILWSKYKRIFIAGDIVSVIIIILLIVLIFIKPRLKTSKSSNNEETTSSVDEASENIKPKD